LDLSQLEPLAEAAGIGGIAIGAVILILSAVINQTQALPDSERTPMLRLLAFIAFGGLAGQRLVWRPARLYTRQ
jgi:hypothetical protein